MVRLLLVLSFGSAVCFGQTCTTATCTAATANESDVLAALPTSGNSNSTVTVTIPSGTATWTTEITYTQPSAVTTLVIIGNGTPNTGTSAFGAGTMNTTITDNGGSSNPLLQISATYPQIAEIEQLNIVPDTTSTALISPIFMVGTCTSSGCPQLRISNINFGTATIQWTEAGNGFGAGQMTRINNYFGVFDHNTIPSGSDVGFSNVSLSSYLGVGLYGDNSWAQGDTFGSANNLFYENNIVYSAGNEGQFADNEACVGAVSTCGGTRLVARYNHTTQTGNGTSTGLINYHGADSGNRLRGGRQAEIYNNSVTCTSVACNTALTSLRSGTALVFGNTVSTGTSYNNLISPAVFRTFAAFTPWAGCGDGNYDATATVSVSGTATGGNGTTTLIDSSQAWTANQWFSSGSVYSVHDITAGWVSEIESNTSTTLTFYAGAPYQTNSATSGDSYQIVRVATCVDQPGRGAGVSLSGATPSPTGSVAEVLDPIYEWDDSTSGSLFDGAFSANDTSRVIANRDWYAGVSGIQTSSSSPFNGTAGSGWGAAANRPSTCTTGVGYAEYLSGSFVQLDECTGTNTWTNAVYTSYTYPHPLDGSGGATSPTVTTTSAGSITTTTASAGGNVTSDGGATVTSRGTCYATSANPTTPCTSDGTGTGSFTSSLSGLTPGTLYHIRAFATNSVGTSYGSDLTFTTGSSSGVGAAVSGGIFSGGVFH